MNSTTHPPLDWKAMNEKISNGQSPELIEHQRAMAVYRTALDALEADGVPYLLGGAYAFAFYTGIDRHTKDLDLFADRKDLEQLLAALQKAGFKTELTFNHWLGKALSPDGAVVDIIFGSGNGTCAVDADWFRHAVPHAFLDVPGVRLIPCEEMIWSKGFILERNRFDGADVAHLLRAQAEKLNWKRLLDRFGDNWPVLLSHLILFGWIYPSERHRLPTEVVEDLLERARLGLAPCSDPRRLCRGTLLSHSQYKIDVASWGYEDARRTPLGRMSQEEIDQWTAAFE